MNYPEAALGAQGAILNRWAEAERLNEDPGYTPPEIRGHYRGDYLWDNAKIDIVYARHGSELSIWAGETGLKSMLAGRLKNGMIPHQQHTEGKRLFDLEVELGHDSLDHSNYFQPPMLAMPALELYWAKRHQTGKDPLTCHLAAQQFLQEVYGPLDESYRYLNEYWSNGPDDRRIGVPKMEGTGRDSGPEGDSDKLLRLPRIGPMTPKSIDRANTAINYAYRLSAAKKLKDTRGDIQKARENFWLIDLEVNCLYAVNCYIMSELASLVHRPQKEIDYYAELGKQVESMILKDWSPYPEEGQGSWHPPDEKSELGTFYAQNKDGEHIREVTCAQVSLLMLPNLREDQLADTLKLINRSLIAEYGVPSVAMDSASYDPNYQEFESIWRGPVWLDQQWFAAQGLLLQINRQDYDLKHRPDLIRDSKELFWRMCNTAKASLDLWAEQGKPVPEFHNPHTGQGYRLARVQNFAWNYLGRVMPPGYEADEMTKVLIRQLLDYSTSSLVNVAYV